ncbi:shikimate kinase [Rhodohalobacter sp. 8-1]|uniref:shikimate kinase n=1 Tax=Rhodohalobacter sp. 8-1 TaxID=3131972 RepID=UPI0030ED8EF8
MDKIALRRPIFLCGMMGSGKSTVGRKLATELEVPFCDLDEMIVEKAGLSIPEIFEQKGEGSFRALERKLLIRESQYFKGVMSLGGGSLQNQHIVDHLKIYGWLIFLDVPHSVISDRVEGDANRPMLKAGSSEKEDNASGSKIERLLEQRLPLYRQAEITVNAGDRPADEIVHEIIKKLTLYDGFNRR